MKIATWNVNSVRARMARLIPWLQEHSPDIVLLQETKVVDHEFPRELIEDEGYNVVAFGEPTYNGVAVLSQWEIEDVQKGLPDDAEDADRRLLACVVRDFVLVDVYVPNGREVGHDHYAYKLDWLRRVRAFLDQRYPPDEKLVVAGDFNVTFDDRDVYDPEAWRDKILCSTPERDALARLMEFGLTDGLRRFHEEAGMFTWWHHRGVAFARNQGLRIDHFLLSQPALDACRDVWVDRAAREGKAPSDHAPVFAEFE